MDRITQFELVHGRLFQYLSLQLRNPNGFLNKLGALMKLTDLHAGVCPGVGGTVQNPRRRLLWHNRGR
jgi:hypothetical protein